jgi:hypothetical protein
MGKKKNRRRRTKIGAVAKQTEERRPTGKRNMIDGLIYVCGVIVVIGGLCIGYLGVSGGFTNQRILALVLLYVTLLFVLTGAFLYFYQNLRNRTPQMAPKIWVKEANMLNVAAEHEPTIALLFENIGGAPARKLFIEITFSWQDSRGGLEYGKPSPNDPIVADLLPPGQTLNGTGFAGFRLNPADIEAIKRSQKFLYVYGRGSFEDESGNKYSSSFCYFVDPRLGLVFCRASEIPKQL